MKNELLTDPQLMEDIQGGNLVQAPRSLIEGRLTPLPFKSGPIEKQPATTMKWPSDDDNGDLYLFL